MVLRFDLEEFLELFINIQSGGLKNEEHPDRTLNVEEIDWIARIVWASQ